MEQEEGRTHAVPMVLTSLLVLIIDNTKGCSERFIRKQIMARIHLPKQAIDEVWIYEKGNVRLFYKDGTFYKNNGGN